MQELEVEGLIPIAIPIPIPTPNSNSISVYQTGSKRKPSAP